MCIQLCHYHGLLLMILLLLLLLDNTEWSDVVTLHVETETTADDNLSAGESRGQLVCRFIKALRGNVIRGLDTAVQHMSLGEHSMIKCRYDHAYASFSMVCS